MNSSLPNLVAENIAVRQRPTTPKNLSSDSVKSLKLKVGLSEDVFFVEVIPEPDTDFNDCHLIVARKVLSHGGRVVHGWLIWEKPGSFIEAVFHSIWEAPSGKLMDITPQADGEPKIAFLSDSRTKWEGIPVKSHRLPLTSNRNLLRSLAIAEQIEELQIKAYLKHCGPSNLPPEEVFLIHRKNTLSGDICMCMSGRKFRHCCKDLPTSVAMRKWTQSMT